HERDRAAAGVSVALIPGLVPGLHGARRAMVTIAMATTHAGGSGVLMAAWMILEMELAAQDSTQSFLPDDHTTVGYEICVRHRRPTPVGEALTVSSELLEVDGRKLLFRVEARNAREIIGEGTLRRTIGRRSRLGRSRSAAACVPAGRAPPRSPNRDRTRRTLRELLT